MAIKKVLVVDDSTADLVNLQKIIADAGYLVMTATSGNEAIKKAQAESPNIIFMDIVMDSMDGYQACREVNQSTKTKDISVVFVTSKNQKADHMWAEMQGGKALVSKPYMAARFSSKSVVSNDSGTAMLPRSRLAGTGGRPGSDYHCQRGLQYGR